METSNFSSPQVKPKIEQLLKDIEKIVEDGKRGERLRAGAALAIVGPPNAGKSSLLNILAGRKAAIVSPEAGTTRDVITVWMDMAGYPVTLMDTAGIRSSIDPIEMEGIAMAKEK